MAYLSLLVPLLTLAVLPLADRLERWALSSDPAAAERPAIRRRRSVQRSGGGGAGHSPSSASSRLDRISLTNSA
jgi:hypothetical protein